MKTASYLYIQNVKDCLCKQSYELLGEEAVRRIGSARRPDLAAARRAAYGALAALLSRHVTGDAPLSWDPDGKPYFPTRPDLSCSLTHDGPYGAALLTLCDSAAPPCGADLMCRRPVRMHEKIARRWFAAVPGLTVPLPPLSREDFFCGWVQTEAYAKMLGTGIPIPDHRPLSHCRLLYRLRLEDTEGFLCAAIAEPQAPLPLVTGCTATVPERFVFCAPAQDA